MYFKKGQIIKIKTKQQLEELCNKKILIKDSFGNFRPINKERRLNRAMVFLEKIIIPFDVINKETFEYKGWQWEEWMFNIPQQQIMETE